MRKKFIIALVTIFMCSTLLGCIESKSVYGKEKGTVAPFTGTWVRTTGDCIEKIYFGKDYSFAYYGDEGNGVDDYDLCDSYKYYKKSKTIKLHYVGKPNKKTTPTTINVVSYSKTKLVLKFNKEKRTFISKKEYDKQLKEKQKKKKKKK